MSADKNGVNVTDISITYCPAGPRDRAVLMVTLRPGRYPTPETEIALSAFTAALGRLMALKQ